MYRTLSKREEAHELQEKLLPQNGNGVDDAGESGDVVARVDMPRILDRAYARLDGAYSYTKLFKIFPLLYNFLWSATGIGILFALMGIIMLVLVVGSNFSPSTNCVSAPCPAQANNLTQGECQRLIFLGGPPSFSCTYACSSGTSSTCNCSTQCPPFVDGAALAGCFIISQSLQTQQSFTVVVACSYLCNNEVCDLREARSPWGVLGTLVVFVVFAIVWFLRIALSGGLLRPYTPSEVLPLLLRGFEVGTFMVSYSWSAGDGEQGSRDLVRAVTGLFPCCWWDRERLLPGSPVEELCVAAANSCAHAFVFVSHAYLRSAICRKELAALRAVPGRVFAFIHSDVAATAEGAELRESLEREGHRVYELHPRPVAFHMHWTQRAARAFLPRTSALMRQLQVPEYDLGAERLPPAHFFLKELALNGTFRRLFRVHTPPINQRWRATAAVLLDLRTWSIHTAFVLLFQLYAIAQIVLLPLNQGQLITAALCLALLMAATVVMQSGVIDLELRRWFKRMPHAAHLLIVLHRLGVVLPNTVMPSTELAPSDASAPRLQRLRATMLRLRNRIDDALVPPPIPVFTDGLHANKFRSFERMGVLRVVTSRDDAEMCCINLDKPENAAVDARSSSGLNIYWTTRSFADLPPETRATLANEVVAVEQKRAGPHFETLLCQLLATKLQLSTPTGITVGSYAWSNKQLMRR